MLTINHNRLLNELRYYLREVLHHSRRRYYNENILAKIFGHIVHREHECAECVNAGQSSRCIHDTSVVAMIKQNLVENLKILFMFQFLRNT